MTQGNMEAGYGSCGGGSSRWTSYHDRGATHDFANPGADPLGCARTLRLRTANALEVADLTSRAILFIREAALNCALEHVEFLL